MPSSQKIKEVLEHIKESSPGQDEFYQAAEEVLDSLRPLLKGDYVFALRLVWER